MKTRVSTPSANDGLLRGFFFFGFSGLRAFDGGENRGLFGFGRGVCWVCGRGLFFWRRGGESGLFPGVTFGARLLFPLQALQAKFMTLARNIGLFLFAFLRGNFRLGKTVILH